MTHEDLYSAVGRRRRSEDVQTLDQTGLIRRLNLGYGPEAPAPGLRPRSGGRVQALGGERCLAVQSQMVTWPFFIC